MRRFGTIWSIGALCALLAWPIATFASPCEGGHYEVDHGECYDMSGDTTSAMLKMYDDGDRLQQGIIDRSRPSVAPYRSGGDGRGVGLPPEMRDSMHALFRSANHILTFAPRPDSIAVDDLTATVPAAKRARARSVMRAMLRDYRSFVASAGLGPNVASTGDFFSLVGAFFAYDGDRFTTRDLAVGTWTGMTIGLAALPALRAASNPSLQRLNDDLALTGATMMFVAEEARAHYDRVALARVRKQALAFLIGCHRVDPRTMRLDDTVGLANRWFSGLSSCEAMKYFISNGRVGSIAPLL